MPDKVKSSVLVLIVSVIILVAISGGFFVMLQKEKAKNVSLAEELEDIKTRLKITETKLDDSKKVVSDLGAKLQQAEGQISELSTTLEQEKVSKDEALAKIEQLRLDLEQQKSLRVDLEHKFETAQKGALAMQAQLKELGAKKTDLETKIKELEDKAKQAQAQSGVELGKIVVGLEKSQKQPAQPVGIAAKVLVVNKDYNFAVINMGSKDGVNVGDVFSVYHNEKYVGDVKVEKIHDSMSAAGFLSADIKDKVFEGDKVVRKGK